MLDQVKRFLAERDTWIEAGRPFRDKEEVTRIFEICQSNKCGKFVEDGADVGHCDICGCYLKKESHFFNKIAWATTECPHEEKYWGPELEKIVEEQPDQIPMSSQDVVEGCGCGG
jgi:hypothetical protein